MEGYPCYRVDIIKEHVELGGIPEICQANVASAELRWATGLSWEVNKMHRFESGQNDGRVIVDGW